MFTQIINLFVSYVNELFKTITNIELIILFNAILIVLAIYLITSFAYAILLYYHSDPKENNRYKLHEHIAFNSNKKIFLIYLRPIIDERLNNLLMIIFIKSRFKIIHGREKMINENFWIEKIQSLSWILPKSNRNDFVNDIENLIKENKKKHGVAWTILITICNLISVSWHGIWFRLYEFYDKSGIKQRSKD